MVKWHMAVLLPAVAALLLGGCAGSLVGGGLGAGNAGTDSGQDASLVASAGKEDGAQLAVASSLDTTAADSGARSQAKARAKAKTHSRKGANQKTAKGVLATAVANKGAYLIGVQDVLDISVFKVPELSKSVQVADTGTINLPLVGEIKAAGRTSRQLERELTRKYGAKYLRNPQITVYVKEFNSRKVTVTGAVKKPGVFPIRGQTTLVSALAMAGGLHEDSSSTVVIFREVKGKRTAARFDISAIQSGNAKDPILHAGDQVVAGKSALKATFGNVLKALPILSAFTVL